MSVRERVRVVHFTTVHPPFDVRIFHKECVTLAGCRGLDVALYAPGAPEGRFQGVEMHGLPRTPKRRITRAVLGNGRLLKVLLRERAAVYHFHDPELLPLAFLLRLFRRRVIYDIHELTPADVGSKPYLRPAVARVLSRVVATLEKAGSYTFSYLICATPTIAEQFSSRRTAIVHNYPILEEFAQVDSEQEYRSRPPMGAMIGNVNEERCATEMYAAAALSHSADPRFQLVVAGRVYQTDDPAGKPGIDYRGVVDRGEVARILGGVRFGLVLLRDLPNCVDALPTKFFEYAGAGLPIVVSRSTTQLAGLVGREQCGIVVDETDPGSISRAFSELVDGEDDAYAMGVRGRAAVLERYNWALEAERLRDVYRQVVGGPGLDLR